ncbi:unnamed protein product [Miscanthus lutarioriparius]|uniref:Uncharacterized protein n=1 Tax=Miscanthus lutarioriparius TaxID=422564 RepID=A0A811PFR3_9POAL|nr:unnamed protein product [Miscanthus lutarioriparius]
MPVFMHADVVDWELMALGLVGAIGDGMSTPLRLLIACHIANNLGSGPDLLRNFTAKIAAFSSLRTIAAFSSQDRILRLFEQAEDGPRRESVRQSWFAGLGIGTSVSLMIFSWVINFWYGARLMAEQRITAEAVFQTTMILVTTGRVIADACRMTADLAKGGDAVASLFAVLYRETNKIQPENRWQRHQDIQPPSPATPHRAQRENIKYGAETASEAEVEDAARSANAHGFITNLKDGYDTWCGDRGVHLSGGQKQRIAIARAILKNPAILLLDEATSALDSASEKAVQEALDRVMAGRTSVVVAHRLSAIHNCAVIAVLEGGVVVEKEEEKTLIKMIPLKPENDFGVFRHLPKHKGTQLKVSKHLHLRLPTTCLFTEADKEKRCESDYPVQKWIPPPNWWLITRVLSVRIVLIPEQGEAIVDRVAVSFAAEHNLR